MSDPRAPLPGELENDVQRSVALLRAGAHDPAVILRALVLSVQQKLQAPPPSAVDQILGPPPAAPRQAPPPVATGPTGNPWLGSPNRSRPAGVPDPSSFGPQSF